VSGVEGRDPGLAFERTSLAWHRTGLSAIAIAALALKALQHRLGVGIPLSAVFAVVGVAAYATGATTPASPRRLRLLSLGVTAAAVLSAAGTIVG
jgi:uncharacterized membrane protein YidH (DUF202 family)